MKYYIRYEDGAIDTVTGKPVKIAGFENYDFFYRKLNGYFIISEVSTGQRICTKDTLKIAKVFAAERITRHIKEFDMLIQQRKI